VKCLVALFLSCLVTPVNAFQDGNRDRPEQGRDAVGIPEALTGFRGLIVGRLVDKDVEKGEFRVTIDHIARVWNNNKAKTAKNSVGKTVGLEGLNGKFLDKLLVIKKGETLQFGALDSGGKRLRVGELFRKVAPFKATDYPQLPDKFRGFKGAVSGTVLKKDPETLELIVKATAVKDIWKENQAQDAKSILGKPFALTGFWRRRNEFGKLKVGDMIEVGLNHPVPQSDHLVVAEFVRGSKSDANGKVAMKDRKMGFSSGVQRFNGMLVGRLVSKDVEKGTFVARIDRVSRVWRNSKANNPKSLVGKEVSVDGVTGKWLDVLLLVKKGETLEFECRHDGGDKMTFPGELMRKVARVKPGDYPELPEEFRGFNGAVIATVIKKDAEMQELIVRADKVKDTWKKNKATKPESIVGKRFILAGFWRRKEIYNDLKVGDKIEVGLEHISIRSDHVSVSEFVRKSSQAPSDKARSKKDD
jgi:hypothetical protein